MDLYLLPLQTAFNVTSVRRTSIREVGLNMIAGSYSSRYCPEWYRNLSKHRDRPATRNFNIDGAVSSEIS